MIKSKKIKILNIDHFKLDKISFVPDMIFIDGTHTVESVRHDLTWALNVIDKDGMLCGNDYGCQVRDAILEQFKESDINIVQGGSLWYVEKSSLNKLITSYRP